MTRQGSAFLSPLSYYKQVYFKVLSAPHFLHFCWWFGCLKCSPLAPQRTEALFSVKCKTAARCPRTRVWESEASFRRWLWAEFNVNDLVPSKGSSHRNTQKTRWCIDWLMEMWPETHRSPPLSLPSEWRLSGQRLQLTQRSPRPDDFPGQDYCTTLVQHRLELSGGGVIYLYMIFFFLTVPCYEPTFSSLWFS